MKYTSTVRKKLPEDPSSREPLCFPINLTTWFQTQVPGSWGVVYSEDYGQSWITQTVGLPPSVNATSIAVDPVSPETIYAGLRISEGIYRSDDGGDTWVSKNSGLSPMPQEVLALSIHPITPTLIFAGSSAGIPYVYRSDNKGESWTSIALTGPNNRKVVDFVFDPFNPAKIYAVVPSEGIFASVDNGLNWTNTGMVGDAFAIDPANPNILYLLNCNLLKSTDGGNSWVPVSPANCFQDLHMDPTDGNTLYLTSSYQPPTRSLDGGDNWTVLDQIVGGGPAPTSRTFEVDPGDTSRLYVFGYGGVFGVWDIYVSIYLDQKIHLPITVRN